MIKNKLIPLFLVAALALAGCASNDEPAATEEPVAETPAAEEEMSSESEAPAEMPVLNELDYTTGLDENGFLEGVTAADHVELFDYDSLDIPSEVHTVSDEMVQAEVDGLLTYFTTQEQVMDRAVVDGDTVNIDYVGSIDGVEFDGGNTQGGGTDVTIGVTSYIDDFLEQLIGHTPGETINVEVTFPEGYQATDLAGKDALFVTTINYIAEDVIPELSDDFVAENLSELYEWNTVDAMKAGIAEELQKTSVLQYIQSDVIANTTVTSVPDSVYDYQKSVMTNYYKGAANQQGLSLEDFIANSGEFESMEDVYTAFEDQLKQASEFTMIIQAVAEEAEIIIDEETLKAYFLEYNGTEDYSEFEGIYGVEYLKYTILQEKVMEYLADNAELM